MIVPQFLVVSPDVYIRGASDWKERLRVVVVVAAEMSMGQNRWSGVRLSEQVELEKALG